MTNVIQQQQLDAKYDIARNYGAATLAAGGVGAVVALTASSTVAIITGIALMALGGAAFWGVLTCYWTTDSAGEFEQNVWKHMTTTGGLALSNLLTVAAQTAVQVFIINVLGGRRS